MLTATPRLQSGGSNRARTYDPLLVRQVLSQLSYAPAHLVVYLLTFPTSSGKMGTIVKMARPRGIEPPHPDPESGALSTELRARLSLNKYILLF